MSKIITISGIDGSGKSACANWIKEILLSAGINSTVVHAMKDGFFAENLRLEAKKRHYNLREFCSADMINLSWTADMIYVYETKIRSLLEKNIVVILHRSDLCCRVYSRVFAPESDMVDSILNNYNYHSDLNLYLEISPYTAAQRIEMRTHSYVKTEKETLNKLMLAMQWYDKYLQMPCYHDVCRINTECSPAETKEVLSKVLGNICYFNCSV